MLLNWSFSGPDGVPDANPEVVIVGEPVDGTKNPKTSVGKTFQDITGVIQYQYATLSVPVVSVTNINTWK